MHIFGLPQSLVDEIPIRVSHTGIDARYVDPAHVAMGFFKASPEAFESYKYEGPPEGMRVGLDLQKIIEFLKKSKKLGESEKVEITITQDRVALKCGRVIARFGLVDVMHMPEPKRPPMEKLPYSAVCVVRGEAFRIFAEAVNSIVETVGVEAVDFRAVGGKLLAVSEADVNEAVIEVGDLAPWVGEDNTPRQIVEYHIDDKGEPQGLHAMFSLDYLVPICKALPEREVSFVFGTNLPLFAQYEDEGISIEAMLAPRIGK